MLSLHLRVRSHRASKLCSNLIVPSPLLVCNPLSDKQVFKRHTSSSPQPTRPLWSLLLCSVIPEECCAQEWFALTLKWTLLNLLFSLVLITVHLTAPGHGRNTQIGKINSIKGELCPGSVKIASVSTPLKKKKYPFPTLCKDKSKTILLKYFLLGEEKLWGHGPIHAISKRKNALLLEKNSSSSNSFVYMYLNLCFCCSPGIPICFVIQRFFLFQNAPTINLVYNWWSNKWLMFSSSTIYAFHIVCVYPSLFNTGSLYSFGLVCKI